jgi:hypothetical protein
MGRPQQTFCTIATLPHFAQRNPAMAQSLPPKMVIGLRASLGPRACRTRTPCQW